MRFVYGTTTETVKTDDRGGWKRVKWAGGAVHWRALLSRCWRLASADCDFTMVTRGTSDPTTAKRVARLPVSEQIARTTTAIRRRDAKLTRTRYCSGIVASI